VKHKSLVNLLYGNPFKIEKYFQPLVKEFAFGHGRIDIIGRDRNAVLCLVEVKVHNSEIPQGKKQVMQYQTQLVHFLSLAGIKISIRGIVVTSEKIVDVGIKKATPVHAVRIPTDIPTSREIFGFKKDSEKVT
jgi:RecB family endonuclease NucS